MNEINNKELIEIIANNALSVMQHGVDYNDLAGTTVEIGYLFDIGGHGIEALFKVITDTGPAYFAAQKDTLKRIEITEEAFIQTTKQFLEYNN